MEATLDLKSAFDSMKPKELVWNKSDDRNKLDFTYTKLFSKPIADELYRQLKKCKLKKIKRKLELAPKDERPRKSCLKTIKEESIDEYIPRPKKRIVCTNRSIRYDFTESPLPAMPWIPALELTRNLLERITKYRYNCVVIKKYKNGIDHLNEYTEEEDMQSLSVPFAILSLGGTREFLLRHKSFDFSANNLNQVKIVLQHGSLILMNPLHYKQWHHALPRSYTRNGTRMSLIFKRITFT
ncbi:DNA oxidative demethylase ALKBH2-like isoform X1 [Agrilus planipennis]|uniref:DNA oxidative demethylase ALKBH2-like isoform X1 n=1 Tax=Agrilus planipennis TaxID=224129 RepID=A0A1W4XWL3_AGRPL|nr:DNA oxidative demethylase ALKBH2-like isoform X1 [Agrilus planipennis]